MEGYQCNKNYIDDLEKRCIVMIEEDLEVFFSAYKKAAYTYSFMISQDLKNFSYATFENMVFSNEEVRALIHRIIIKVHKEIEDYLGCYIKVDEACCYNLSDSDTYRVLEETLEGFKITQGITKNCEKVLKGIFSKTFKSLCPYVPAQYVAKKINISEKILSEKSSKNQRQRHQEIIFQQIQGILLNIKVDIRNQLTEKTIKNIHYSAKNTLRVSNYSIA